MTATFQSSAAVCVVCALVACLPAGVTVEICTGAAAAKNLRWVLPPAELQATCRIAGAVTFVRAFLTLLPAGPTKTAADAHARSGRLRLSRFWRGVLVCLVRPGLVMIPTKEWLSTRVIRLPLQGQRAVIEMAQRENKHWGGPAFIELSDGPDAYLLLDARAARRIQVDLDESGFRLILKGE